MAPSFSPQPLVPSLRSLLCWCSLIFVPSGNSVCSLQQYHCCELSWQSLTPGLWTLTFPFLFFHTSPCSLDFNFFYPGMDFLLSSSLLNQLPVVQVARPQDNQLDGLRHLIPQTNTCLAERLHAQKLLFLCHTKKCSLPTTKVTTVWINFEFLNSLLSVGVLSCFRWSIKV